MAPLAMEASRIRARTPMQSTATAEPTHSTSASRQSARQVWRGRLIRLGVIVPLLWLAWHYYYVLFAGNVHVVIPGKLIRGAQPSAQSLESLIEKHKIRTVLNVRGCCWPDE